MSPNQGRWLDNTALSSQIGKRKCLITNDGVIKWCLLHFFFFSFNTFSLIVAVKTRTGHYQSDKELATLKSFTCTF